MVSYSLIVVKLDLTKKGEVRDLVCLFSWGVFLGLVVPTFPILLVL